MDERAVIEFAVAQRWFGWQTRSVVHAEVVDHAALGSGEPPLELQLVELRFETGTHCTYQLLTDDSLDALADPAQARALLDLIHAGARVETAHGVVEFHGLGSPIETRGTIAPIDAEQSNTSIVFDDELILKVFRRLSPGLNPELELLRFLTERGFENIARLAGWYTYTGKPLDATLGILQHFVAGGLDGWDLALDTMGDGSGGVLPKLRRLGEVTGRMHSLLGSEQADPNFRPDETSSESLGLLTATVDEEIERIFVELPEGNADLDPIRGRGEEVRERLRMLTNIGGAGRVIRNHGDFHLGQALWANGDWVIIDFEGEPARPLSERRQKRSPLRDVAGMLRSFAYAASASAILNGVDPPVGWEEQARSEFLAGYSDTVDQTLVPAGAAMGKLLAVFELEKAVYELRYELNNRPDWTSIPVAGIMRMLEGPVPV